MTMVPRKSIAVRGFILTETSVALALVGMVLGVASLLITQHARAMDYLLDYRRAQLAAESCLERMRLGDIDMVDSAFRDAFGVAYEIHIGKPDIRWEPLRLAQVRVVVGTDKSRKAHYSLSAYLNPAKAKGVGP